MHIKLHVTNEEFEMELCFLNVISLVQLVFKEGCRQQETTEAFYFCVEIKEQQTSD